MGIPGLRKGTKGVQQQDGIMHAWPLRRDRGKQNGATAAIFCFDGNNCVY